MKTARIDRSGRVRIPKGIRERLNLLPGTVLRFEERDGYLLIEPVDAALRVVTRKGVLVYTGPAVGDLLEAIPKLREERLTLLAIL